MRGAPFLTDLELLCHQKTEHCEVFSVRVMNNEGDDIIGRRCKCQKKLFQARRKLFIYRDNRRRNGV